MPNKNTENKTVFVTLVRSPIGYTKDQKQTVLALGLRRMAALFAEALPDVQVEVTEWQPGDQIAADAARVLTGEQNGETVVIANFYEGAKARPLYFPRDGAQRHDRVGRRWKCAKCGAWNG